MELVTGLAPNLNEVVVLNLFPPGPLGAPRRRAAWQGLPGFTRGKRGSLKILSLREEPQLGSPRMLQDWTRHIDFTSLQHLTLGDCPDFSHSGINGETMEWIVQTQSFPRLKSFGVQITRDDFFVEKPQFREQAISFFQIFEPLEQLSIDGPIDYQIMDSVLARHGQTLRRLSLYPFEATPNCFVFRDLRALPFHFTKDCVLRIRDQCPVLEELTILVRRTKSSASEADVYRCFGLMENLKALSLMLECSNWRVTRDPTYEPEYEGEDREPVETGEYSWLKRGDLKETLINCAVNEALASSIWKTISQNKTGRPLERLELRPTGAGKYGACESLPATFHAFVENLARSWLLERVPRDDKEEFTITELRQKRRLARDQRNALFLAHPQDFGFWNVFRSIWPSKDGSKDFRDDWWSFPL